MLPIELLPLAIAAGLGLHSVLRHWRPPELRMPRWLLTRAELAFQQWRLDLWNDTAVSCGLRVMDISHRTSPRLRIEARAEPVTMRIEEPLIKKSGIRVVAVFPGPWGFSEITIRHRAPKEMLEMLGTETGDELFDRSFFLKGSSRLLSALLDVEMRRLLVSIKAENRLEISRGKIRLETSDEDLKDVLSLLLDISRRLAQDIDPVQRLAENARRDPVPGVRLRNLLLLVREVVEVPATTEALRAACSDASPQIRLRAAVELGAQGRDALVQLAEGLEDDACSAEAVTRLGRKMPVERTRAVLTGALRQDRLRTALACLKTLGRRADPADVDMLAEVLAAERGELAVAAARALGATGSLAAVVPLQDAAERSPDDPELLRAIRQALAGIKARQPGVSPGQISLAATETGQLSMAPEPGQLSLAPDEAGRLSLAPAENGRLTLPPKGPEKV